MRIVEGDLKDRASITAALEGVARVYHFASNPDIAKAMTEPDVDFWEGTYLARICLRQSASAPLPSSFSRREAASTAMSASARSARTTAP